METITFWCNGPLVPGHAHYEGHMVQYEQEGVGTGYSTSPNGTEKMCYECAAVYDRERMVKLGRYDLYLSKCDRPATWPRTMAGETYGTYKITNWPGTLTFYCGEPRKGRHNIAGSRYDVWFTGPDNYLWHGVQYGDHTQIVHCRRTKDKA